MSDAFPFVAGLAVMVAILAMLIAASTNADRRLRDARAAYDASLAKLKQSPTDPDLKQQTLALGRRYSNLTRQQEGVTLYDEVALSNEIGAACAGAMRASSHATPPSAEARLARLTDLRTQGLVTADEYQAQRARILAEI